MIEEPTEFAILWTKQYPQLVTLSWLRLQEETNEFLSIDSFYHGSYKFPVWRQVPTVMPYMPLLPILIKISTHS